MADIYPKSVDLFDWSIAKESAKMSVCPIFAADGTWHYKRRVATKVLESRHKFLVRAPITRICGALTIPLF